MRTFIFFIFLSCTFPSFAQDKYDAMKHIQKLCSKEFAGRGYVQNGDKTAADYLAKQLKIWKLQSFSKNYFQRFKISVNTFPSSMFLKVDTNELVAGIDFLIDPSSNGLTGNYDILRVTPQLLIDTSSENLIFLAQLKNKVMYFDTLGLAKLKMISLIDKVLHSNPFGAAAIIMPVGSKMTWGVSTDVEKHTILYVDSKYLQNIPKKMKVDIKNRFYNGYKTQNVIGTIQGEIDSFVVFTAHYDHLGKMGRTAIFPGAHDNATGTATVLELAKYFSKLSQKPKYSVAFMFFTGEELGLLGSFYYAANPLFPLSKIKFLLNLDLLGSGDDGVQVVNSTVHPTYYEKLLSINETEQLLPQIKPRGPAANSDHFPFYKKGVPAFFIYSLGTYKEYHNVHDKAENLVLPKYTEIFNLMLKFYQSL